jgi:transglutaminase-like putative cysteine protease
MPLVAAWDSQTNVTTERTTPNPNTWKDPLSGNGILSWQFTGEPGSGALVVITDEFTYTCYQVSYEIDLNKIGMYDKASSDYQLYTRPEKYLEADDVQIKKIASELQQDKTNPYSIAASIYDWVMNHLTYRNVRGLSGAKFALENGYGNCGDYSALFTALCRAAGVPARPIVGRWATSDPADWHVWAEFYLPGYGWLPVDPTHADLTGKGRDYFGNLDNRRLILHKGFNIVLQPRPGLIGPEYAHLQTFVWEYQGVAGQIQADLTYTINPLSQK